MIWVQPVCSGPWPEHHDHDNENDPKPSVGPKLTWLQTGLWCFCAVFVLFERISACFLWCEWSKFAFLGVFIGVWKWVRKMCWCRVNPGYVRSQHSSEGLSTQAVITVPVHKTAATLTHCTASVQWLQCLHTVWPSLKSLPCRRGLC